MTSALYLFFAFGVAFGLATWSNRHLFSEGHTRRSAPGEDDGWGSRIVWVMVCSALWPLMALTGVYGALHRARVRARQAAQRRR